MTPKEIMLATLRHQETPRAAWVPFAGVHAGHIKGYTATDVLSNADKCVEVLLEANRLYRPDGLPVLFDLQIEAECLGCDLLWDEKAPPSVSSHPLAGDELVIPCDCTLPTKESGRIPFALEVMTRMVEAVGETTALYGLICGPFTLASHLRGNDLFYDMYDDDEYVINLLKFCNKACKRVADFYIEAGMDIIAVVDPLISQISAEHFEEFMQEPYADLFDHIREKNTLSAFFVCGDATRNIENMCKTGPDSISIDENVDLAAAKKITDKYNVCIGGNIQLTIVMLHGTQQDNMKAVIDIFDSVDNRKNLIISPGCDMPYDVPVENTIGAAQAVLEEDSVRKVLENYTAVGIDIDVELPDYAALTKPLVEVFTLDSATCAACTYMMGAANEAKEFFGDKIDMVEYKFTIKENIARCMKMQVPNLPSMYINGELKYRSIIPNSEELHSAINNALATLG